MQPAGASKQAAKINALDKKYFREIFLLHANAQQKITYEKL